MKHVIIGDLHGRDTWKKADIRKYEKVVFLGDYVDSFTRPDFIVLENLKNVLQLKTAYPEKVVLLLGNHDVQYLHYPKYPCPGFRPSMQPELTRLFSANHHLFQMAYEKNSYICTHAGISTNWFYQFLKTPGVQDLRVTHKSLAALINKTEQTEFRDILYKRNCLYGGTDSAGGILWAHGAETMDDLLGGYHQVVGHNAVDEISKALSYRRSITYIDVLHKQTCFHELDI